MFSLSIQVEYSSLIFSTKYLFLDLGEVPCLLCMTFEVLTHLHADVPTVLPKENIQGFLRNLDIDPFGPGDPQEFISLLSGRNSQLTLVYAFSFMQEGNTFNVSTTTNSTM